MEVLESDLKERIEAVSEVYSVFELRKRSLSRELAACYPELSVDVIERIRREALDRRKRSIAQKFLD